MLRRDYNPADEGNTAQAIAYLASSPAARVPMALSDPAHHRQLTTFVKPYSGEPPPRLSGSGRPDLFTRLAGIAVPHFVSLVMRLGGDNELPELPAGPSTAPQCVSRAGASWHGMPTSLR